MSESKMIKGKITVSRPSYGDGREKIEITIEDRNAVISFLEIHMNLDDFAKCITGEYVDCEFEARGLDNVGKVRETKTIKFKIADDYIYSGRKPLAIEKAKKHTPDGWVASEYYGSQNSFFIKLNEQWATTSITRWVDNEIRANT